jgi:hypothetical protein
VKPLTLAQLRNVWDRVIQDPDAHRALVRLERDGFRIRQLEPRDPTLKYPNWADYIAAIRPPEDRFTAKSACGNTRLSLAPFAALR